jgi:hypothetical protein
MPNAEHPMNPATTAAQPLTRAARPLSREDLAQLLGIFSTNGNKAASVRDALHEAVHAAQIEDAGGCFDSYARNDLHEALVTTAQGTGDGWQQVYVGWEAEARACELACARWFPEAFKSRHGDPYDVAEACLRSVFELIRDREVSAGTDPDVFLCMVREVDDDRVADLLTMVKRRLLGWAP